MFCAALLASRRSTAETRAYVIAIGNNQAPAAGRVGDDSLSRLRYADDDAASVATFARELGAETTLLTVLDAESLRRFPALIGIVRPPTLHELRRVVAWHRARIETDRRDGHDPVVVLFYSGHGTVLGGPPALAMLDGPLSRSFLYDEILSALPARYIHLLVDACHAEAVVRPRDAQAELVHATDNDLRELADRNTLRRFPNVGAVIATSSLAEAHEWDLYQRGVFTHEVVSALRGAADVNDDGLVEYSELFAFLGAANAEVADPRGKLSVLVRPPSINPRAPMVDLGRARLRQGNLHGPWPKAQRFFLEDERGNRLLEMRPESGFRFDLIVPSGETLYVRDAQGETSLILEPGAHRAMTSVPMAPSATRPRGAMEVALRRGLFSAPFGPAYYRAFTNAVSDIPAVPVASLAEAAVSGRQVVDRGTSVQKAIGLGLLGTAGALVGTSIAMSVLAIRARDSYRSTDLERHSAEARDRFERDRSLAIGMGAGALVFAGFGLWLLGSPLSSPGAGQISGTFTLHTRALSLSAAATW